MLIYGTIIFIIIIKLENGKLQAHKSCQFMSQGDRVLALSGTATAIDRLVVY